MKTTNMVFIEVYARGEPKPMLHEKVWSALKRVKEKVTGPSIEGVIAQQGISVPGRGMAGIFEQLKRNRKRAIGKVFPGTAMV